MKTKKFEYMVREDISTYELNRLGQDGWEMVGCMYIKPTCHYYLKRRIQ